MGKAGIKKTPQQFTNANSPGATPEAETAVVSNGTVPQKGTGVNSHSMQNSSEYVSSIRQSEGGSVMGQLGDGSLSC